MIRQVADPVLEVHNLTVRYRHKTALWNVDFSLPSGVLVGILGPNGAGKSTLLKSIVGLIKPHSGYIHLFRRPVHQLRYKLAYVPQKEEVNWDLPITVEETVLMGRYPYIGLLQRPHQEDYAIATSAMEKMGIIELAKRHIGQLSGGQQQRVFLARALAQNADIYLMDEPFAGVDIATEHAIVAILKEMKQLGKTILIVHHDLYSAYEYFDWLILLNGHLVASAPVQEAFQLELLQRTYGGKLTTLSKLTQMIQQKP